MFSFLKILWVHLLQTKERRRILQNVAKFETEMRKSGKRLWTDRG